MATIVSIAAVTWLLMVGESVLRPLATALLVVVVLSAVSERIVRLVPPSWRRGKTVTRLLSSTGILMILTSIAFLVGESLMDLRASLPVYVANLDFLLKEVQTRFGIVQYLSMETFLNRLDLQSLAIGLAASTAAYGSVFFVVMIYVIFIFAEVPSIGGKLSHLAATPDEERRLRIVVAEIKRAIDDVIGVQVLVGVIQAVPTFAVLTLVGVDAAVLWAVFVFFFSFIPTIGTVFGVGVPSLITLLQFMELQPFIVVLACTGIVQVIGTNILMPRLMSRSLNVSALATVFAVFAGGAVWGIVGAIIAVPVLTIAMIVCAKVASLRRFAVLISADGSLPQAAVETPGQTADGPLPQSAVTGQMASAGSEAATQPPR